MYSNYNELIVDNDTYKSGDIFHYDGFYDRFKIFNGLKIKSINYQFDNVILVFDWNEWEEAKKKYCR